MLMVSESFHCPARYSEVLPADLEGAGRYVEGLASHVLRALPAIALVNNVEINFCLPENMYIIHIRICYYEQANTTALDLDTIELRIECVLSQALLQLFWEVYS